MRYKPLPGPLPYTKGTNFFSSINKEGAGGTGKGDQGISPRCWLSQELKKCSQRYCWPGHTGVASSLVAVIAPCTTATQDTGLSSYASVWHHTSWESSDNISFYQESTFFMKAYDTFLQVSGCKQLILMDNPYLLRSLSILYGKQTGAMQTFPLLCAEKTNAITYTSFWFAESWPNCRSSEAKVIYYLGNRKARITY